jgi:L-serine dehydratase
VILVAVSLFDVIGPIMVGPSSSHTAGAVRLGNVARSLCSTQPQRVEFYLHGSFAQTYQGHGTGQALVGGMLGFLPDDERIRDSYQLAAQNGMEYAFFTEDLGDVHPNSVRILSFLPDGSSSEMIGSSIGGGKILVTRVNGMAVKFTGQYPTLITRHQDQPGMVARISGLLSQHDINTAFLEVFRSARGSLASMVIETDQPVSTDIMEELIGLEGVQEVLLVDCTCN